MSGFLFGVDFVFQIPETEQKMKFNYQTEKRKFESRWEILRTEYEKAGMAKEIIEEIYNYDWEMFKKERIFCNHNQYLCDADEKRTESHVIDTYFAEDENYLESFESYELTKEIEKFNMQQKQILRKYVFEGKSQKEIAIDLNMTQQAVSKQISAIRKKLKKFI